MEPSRLREVATCLAFSLSVMFVTAAFSVPAHSLTTTVVSLTFDDGAQDQYDNARSLLSDHGMKGTFYINSGRVGTSGYMTWSEIAALASDGNEIGGHTITHPDLPTLSTDDQQRQICNDRVALLNMGFAIKNLAYPHGGADANTKQIAYDCGYNSARKVGGIVSPGLCHGCGYAESIPPSDAYYTRTPDSVRTNTSLATLKGYVTQAEAHGGGWVQLVIHHVCDGCADTYAVSPSTLASFLDWLQPRSLGGTSVKTVDEVIGGPVQPPISGPL